MLQKHRDPKTRAIEEGRKTLDMIERHGVRLSPGDDVDRAMTSISGLSMTEVHDVRGALLAYAFEALHGERWHRDRSVSKE